MQIHLFSKIIADFVFTDVDITDSLMVTYATVSYSKSCIIHKGNNRLDRPVVRFDFRGVRNSRK